MKTDSPDQSRLRGVRPRTACLGLGSNADPARNLAAAVQSLARSLAVEAISTAWESPAVGVDAHAHDYVNAALLVRTVLAKDELIGLLKRTEVALGRSRDTPPSPRVPIDIDLLVFDGVVQEPDLWDLAYRAVPAAELLPDLRRPNSAERLAAAAVRLAAATPIRPRPDILRVANRPRTARADATGFTRLPIP